MTDTQVGLVITGVFMLLATVSTGYWAHRNKKTPEPTPMEKLWDRLDIQDGKIEGLKQEVGTLQDQVVAYRGGFLAHVSWAARVQAAHTGPMPIIPFTFDEQQAIQRGLDMAALQQVHRDATRPEAG